MSNRTCDRCERDLPPTKRPDLQRYCSPRCARPVPERQAECTQCGALFASRRGWKVCSPACRKARDTISLAASSHRRGSSHLGRARYYGCEYEPISRLVILERDGWKCGICRGDIDPNVAYPDLRSASLDHIVPLSLGGPHLMSNVQAAHLICNIEKGAKLLPVA